jgi:hypothetical protein
MNTYTQCELIKGNVFQHAWIPSEFAVIGKVLKIKYRGIWEDGWKVAHIFGMRFIEYVEEHERDYLKQRVASDI